MLRLCLVSALVLTFGCTPSPRELHQPLSQAPVRHLHGDDLVEQLVRVGVMFDAASPRAVEVRTSRDGLTWTPWRAPTIVFAEAGAYAGHVDAPEGSTRFEYRVTEVVPTWLFVEPIESLGEPSTALPEGPPASPRAAVPQPAVRGEAVGTRRDALAPFPTILPRSAWNARAPTCTASTSVYRMVVHHTASPTNDASTPEVRLRQTQSYHMDTRGYCDIAYNFLMSRDARVWAGRGDSVLGGHTLNQNGGNMALCLIGTYTTDTLTSAQECAAAGWMAWQHSLHGITLNRTNIKGHREWGSTACPGDTVFARLDALVQQASTTCEGLTPPRPQWGAQFVSQSFVAANLGVVTIEEGQWVDGWFELRNIGASTWSTATTRLAPTPREVGSPLADPSWLSPVRVSNVLQATAPDAVGRFPARLRGNTVGRFTQTFGLMTEGAAWFADQGGPADGFITVQVEVVPRASGPDAGAPAVDAGIELPILSAAIADDGIVRLPAPSGASGGCGCASFDGASMLGLLAVLVARSSRRRISERTQETL